MISKAFWTKLAMPVSLSSVLIIYKMYILSKKFYIFKNNFPACPPKLSKSLPNLFFFHHHSISPQIEPIKPYSSAPIKIICPIKNKPLCIKTQAA